MINLKTNVLYITRGTEGEKLTNSRLRLLTNNPNKKDDKFLFVCVLSGNTYRSRGQYMLIDGDENSQDIIAVAPIKHGQEITLEKYDKTKLNFVAVDLDGDILLIQQQKVYDKDGYKWM